MLLIANTNELTGLHYAFPPPGGGRKLPSAVFCFPRGPIYFYGGEEFGKIIGDSLQRSAAPSRARAAASPRGFPPAAGSRATAARRRRRRGRPQSRTEAGRWVPAVLPGTAVRPSPELPQPPCPASPPHPGDFRSEAGAGAE